MSPRTPRTKEDEAGTASGSAVRHHADPNPNYPSFLHKVSLISLQTAAWRWRGLPRYPPSLPSESATRDGDTPAAWLKRSGREEKREPKPAKKKKRRKPPKPPPRDRAPGASIYLIIFYSFSRPPSRGGTGR